MRGLSFVVMVLLSGTVHAAADDAGAAPAKASSCPAPVRDAPVYPEDMLRTNQQGSAVLDLRVDACGRVTSVELGRSSGLAPLDDAAVAAARTWVLDAGALAGAQDGRLSVPVDFTLPRLRSYPHVGNDDWPKSHRRPRYVADDLPDHATPEHVLEHYDLQPQAVLTPPYPYVRNMLFRQRGDDPVEYWLFMYVDGRARVAARYRLVMENGDPVVRLAIACEGTAKHCARDRKLLMKGLPFAKAR